ncbi:MAG: hypothetical protein ACYSWP_07640 [Planctomycetota bacterium]|jgi:hypothetical protein
METESGPPKGFTICPVTRGLIALAALSIAFGYIEASVVVYLRAIFYPDGFVFPLTEFGIETSPLWRRLLLTEIGREASTLVLIISGAYLFGRNVRERVAGFMIIFGIWDIFFYVWLKVLVNWPGSIMDWDILFLIPVYHGLGYFISYTRNLGGSCSCAGAYLGSDDSFWSVSSPAVVPWPKREDFCGRLDWFFRGRCFGCGCFLPGLKRYYGGWISILLQLAAFFNITGRSGCVIYKVPA